jgi:hypothetical protein
MSVTSDALSIEYNTIGETNPCGAKSLNYSEIMFLASGRKSLHVLEGMHFSTGQRRFRNVRWLATLIIRSRIRKHTAGLL